MIELRPHQQAAYADVMAALKEDENVLLQAPCAFGKTILFCKIIQDLLAAWPGMRILLLAHQDLLVTQAKDKLVVVAPELKDSIGIACASVSAKKVLYKQITIASRQTLINLLDKIDDIDLCIIDEVHLMAIPGRKEKTQYEKIIESLRKFNPKMRLLGVTATPYRLNAGYIYGEECRPDLSPIFSRLHHKCEVESMVKQGFLAPLTGKVAQNSDLTQDLTMVKKQMGEFVVSDLAEVMNKEVYLNFTLEAYRKHAEGRTHTMVFCVNIDHAEKVMEIFKGDGVNTYLCHSKLSKSENEKALANFEQKGGVICNVAKLTTGLDIPAIDCIILARRTASTALFAQIVGRGMRIFDGKGNCLIIDLVGNCELHGFDLDNLNIIVPNKAPGETGSINQDKLCPECESLIHFTYGECPDCGYVFSKEEMELAEKKHDPVLVEASFGKQPPVWYDITGVTYFEHTSKKNKKVMMKVHHDCGSMMNPKFFCAYIMFEDHYSGFPVKKSRGFWNNRTDEEFPDSVEEALFLADELAKPTRILVDENGKFPEILSYDFDEVEDMVEKQEQMEVMLDELPF